VAVKKTTIYQVAVVTIHLLAMKVVTGLSVVLAKIQSLTLMQHKEILDLQTVKTSNFADVEE
jgi:hypothetical protein